MKLQINENNDDQFADVICKSLYTQLNHYKTQLKSLSKECDTINGVLAQMATQPNVDDDALKKVQDKRKKLYDMYWDTHITANKIRQRIKTNKRGY